MSAVFTPTRYQLSVDPVTDKYAQKIERKGGDNVSPFALPAVMLAVAEIFK
jgi:hypothetical protein